MTEKKSLYADDRAYLSGIKEVMKRSESELVARLDELRDQMRFVDNAINALNVYEHINASSEVSNA